jgi:uncharacterized sodium:solute symporter family permease YidK
MRFGDPFGWAWVLATGGGALALAIGFAMMLLQRRRRRSGKLEVSSEALAPEPNARAEGRALHALDLISCIAGVWLFVSPWVLGTPETAVSWFSGSNGICGALIAIFALSAYYRETPAQELVIGIVSLWVFASPWVVERGGIPAVMAWSNWITAAIIVLAALSGVIRPSHQPSQLAARR